MRRIPEQVAGFVRIPVLKFFLENLERGRVEKANDPLLMGIRVAIAGNIIDFGVNTHIDLEQEIEQILKQDFAIFDYIPFKKRR